VRHERCPRLNADPALVNNTVRMASGARWDPTPALWLGLGALVPRRRRRAK
jgi:hypothetical protein